EYPWPNYEAHITASALAIQYKLPSYHCRYRTVVTNKSPSGAYRGIGQPIAVFVLERLLDMAARKLGMDPAEIRRINMVGEDEYPCTTALGTVIESGSHRAALDAALAAIGYEDFRRAQARARNAGRHMGIGIAHYVEMTAPGTPLWKMIGARLSGFEPALVRIERDGRVTVIVGVNSQGQSHETVFAQLAADVLGVAIDEVRVVQGDSAMMPRGGAVGGSKSAVATGGAVLLAAQKLRERLAAIVAVAKEVPADAVEIRDGVIYDRGSNTALCTLAEAAREVWMGNWGLEQEDKGLEVLVHYEPPLLTHSNATHVATVEVDPETGGVRILRYVVAEDCGRLINPRVVDGQVQGGIAQGIGQALYEEVVHDAAGQILNGTLMDYLLPTAMDVPAAEIDHIETPSPHTMGGIKGAGEGGKIAPPAAIANAVADALAPFNVRANRLPLTPERILEMIAGGPLPDSAAEAHTEAARDMNGEGFAIRGEHHVRAAREALWALLLDPERLARCLPGCRRLEIVGDHEYAGEMKIGIAGIRGVYAGRV
ncbi:MAG TPA: molybdopterin cofactor-binding domain-containing protein, partial [Sphingomonadales bacterium]